MNLSHLLFTLYRGTINKYRPDSLTLLLHPRRALITAVAWLAFWTGPLILATVM